MAACTFYQNTLRASRVNDLIKMMKSPNDEKFEHNEEINLLT